MKDTDGGLIGMTKEDLIAIIKATRGDDDLTLQKRAQYEAEARQKLTRKENETHPGISAFSHPAGDRDQPKDALKCKMFWVGGPLVAETLRPEEIAVLNRARPGEFQFRKTDGSVSTLTVTASLKADGEAERLEFFFPCRGDNKHNLPGLTAMLRDAFQEPTEEDRLRAENAALQQALGQVMTSAAP